ncbi:peptide ABC transporter substrate-binding protein, partial [Enterococcus hirae]|nr:peptide ABC transporter substrate-binding protein [Enterococcus hirae]EMF0177884.1 peptide ABC transporter substrate-binding protein [Enterococcus hirae]
MKKKWAFSVVALSGLVLAGCYGGSANTKSSNSASGNSTDGGGVFNLVVPQEMPTAD